MVGHGLAYVAYVPVDGRLWRLALGEGGQGRGCWLVVCGLEVENRLVGGDLLEGPPQAGLRHTEMCFAES